MTEKEKSQCSRSAEIDRLVEDVKGITKSETKLELMINDLQRRFESHTEAINKKLDDFITSVNQSCERKDNSINKLDNEMLKVKATIVAVKWIVVGMILTGFCIKFGFFEMISKLF